MRSPRTVAPGGRDGRSDAALVRDVADGDAVALRMLYDGTLPGCWPG